MTQSSSEEWELAPLEAVGDIRFGMTREQVKELFGSAPFEFNRGDEFEVIDAYNEASVQVAFGSKMVALAVELVYEVPVLFKGGRLNGRPYADVLADLKLLGIAPTDGDTQLFDDLGGALSVTRRGDVRDFVESAYFCARDYYPDYREGLIRIGNRMRERRERRAE